MLQERVPSGKPVLQERVPSSTLAGQPKREERGYGGKVRGSKRKTETERQRRRNRNRETETQGQKDGDTEERHRVFGFIIMLELLEYSWQKVKNLHLQGCLENMLSKQKRLST